MTSKAVVLGLYEANGLGVVRSLGIENIPIVGYDLPGLFPHAAHSKYLNHYNIARNETGLLERLLEDGQREETKPVVYATGDNFVLFCQNHSSELGKYYHLPLVEGRDLNELLEKKYNLEIGKESGFLVPVAQYLSDKITIKGKLIAKPLSSVGTSKEDIFIFDDNNSLNAQKQRLLDKYQDMLIMEYIEGGVDDHYEVHTYNSSKGPLIAGMVQKLLAVKNSTQGSIGAIAQNVWIDELVEPSLTLTRNSGFNGALDINLKKDINREKYYFTEVNYRTSGNLMLDTISGLNLPAIIYNDILGNKFNHLLKPIRLGYKWISEGVEARCLIDNLNITPEEYQSYRKGEKIFVFYDTKDPMPYAKALETNNFLFDKRESKPLIL